MKTKGAKSRRTRNRSVQSPTARRYVQDEIRRRILSGESHPGERVAQQSLAKRLGVGQGSVREALVELQWLGLVDQVDGLGFFVGNINARRLHEAYEVREFLEGLAARCACENASLADITSLRNNADRILKLSYENKDEEAGAADRAFHLQIISLSRNEILNRLAEGYRVLGMAVRASRDPGAVHEEHLRIVDAIQANLPNEAEMLVREHVADARKAIADQAANEDFLPKWVLNAGD